MNATLVARVPKNKLEEIRVGLKNNKIDLRTYFYFPTEPRRGSAAPFKCYKKKRPNEPEPKPTKKGIWLLYKHVPPIIDAFGKYSSDPRNEFHIEFESKENEKIKGLHKRVQRNESSTYARSI